jgi:hypothetical protein
MLSMLRATKFGVKASGFEFGDVVVKQATPPAGRERLDLPDPHHTGARVPPLDNSQSRSFNDTGQAA